MGLTLARLPRLRGGRTIRGMTPSNTARVVEQADAHLANLLHLADALPEFAVSPAFGGSPGGDGGTVTDVLAQILAEQEALTAGATPPPSPQRGEDAGPSQHAHRPYKEMRELITERHAELSEAALAGRDDAREAVAHLGGRYEWAQSVLGQCAL